MSTSKIKKTVKKKKNDGDEEYVMAGSSLSSVSSKGGKIGKKKKGLDKTSSHDEQYLKKIEDFFNSYKNKNDKLDITTILDKLKILDLPGCELLKKKLLKREEDIHMKNKNPQEKERRGKIPLDLDLKEFRELFSFDFADDLDYEFVFDRYGETDFDVKYISYHHLLEINRELQIGLSEKDMVLMFNHTDINNQQIPLTKLKDLINDWKKTEEIILESDL